MVILVPLPKSVLPIVNNPLWKLIPFFEPVGKVVFFILKLFARNMYTLLLFVDKSIYESDIPSTRSLYPRYVALSVIDCSIIGTVSPSSDISNIPFLASLFIPPAVFSYF
jgi:hypothetical protein